MKFNHFLSAYYPDTSYGGARLYADMLEQARTADRLGYSSVSVPEHHLINILLTPAPLQMAVKVAAETRRVKVVTSVCVLPLHDMRIFAGEVAMADILCEGRLIVGVGRGAFAYELARLGTKIEDSREKFDESLNVLMALLSAEEVSWQGRYYNFEPLTIMPRPLTQPMPRLMMAALVPEAIYHSVKRGFHIQTTPLQGSHDKMLEQTGAFHRGKAELGDAGKDLSLSLSRVAFVTTSDADRRRKLELAYDYYRRFDNVMAGPGQVKNGAIAPLPRKQTIEELDRNLLICSPAEMIDQLAVYAEAGVDEMIFSMNIGAEQSETIEAMHLLAEEVMPHFSAGHAVAAAQ